ncbi:MAG TPA: dihydroorotase [bacterium]|nr:dihydroorotase [bacterium]HQI48232.1 dihydroorotase [bacterium]HQJ65104.1 dihydroorotase [bacterium]
MESLQKVQKILLQGGEVLDLGTGQRQPLDLLIVDGRIAGIGRDLVRDYEGEIVDLRGQLIVPGLLDMHVHLREPGREDEETIESGCAAAMAGGITAVCAMPNTEPACDSQEVVRFLKKRAEEQLVEVFPIAAVTKKREGKEITEMAELIRAGAVAFSDDGSPVKSAAVMRRALEYSSMYEVPVIDHCEEPELAAGGQMHEGWMSTRLGLPGVPDIAEAVMIARDLALAEFTGGQIHIAHLSTAKGLELVRRGKEKGVKVTCEVTPHHLALTDEALEKYDTNLKMNPPLRSRADVEALFIGLRDGTIDVIASDHAPHSIEEKEVEFQAAPNGILGLQTMLGIILTKVVAAGELPLHEALAKMILAPRRVLGLPLPLIKEGTPANLSFFSPEEKWTVTAKRLKSRSRNMPYEGWSLPGVVCGVINRGMLWTAEL